MRILMNIKAVTGLIVLMGIVWMAPAFRPDDALAMSMQTAATPPAGDIGELTDLVTRKGLTGEGFEVEVILATPEFMAATGRTAEAEDLGANDHLVFVMIVAHHGDIDEAHAAHGQWRPFLQIDGKSIHVPSDMQLLADDGHHQTTAYGFADLPVALLSEQHLFELMLPSAPDGTRPSMTWITPFFDEDGLATPQSVPEAAGVIVFFSIRNTGCVADVLVSADSSSAGQTLIYRAEDLSDISKAELVDSGIELPAAETVDMHDEGQFLLLTDLTAPIEPGDVIEIRLVFQYNFDAIMPVVVVDPATGSQTPDDSDSVTVDILEIGNARAEFTYTLPESLETN